jgi:hypothetical protein
VNFTRKRVIFTCLRVESPRHFLLCDNKYAVDHSLVLSSSTNNKDSPTFFLNALLYASSFNRFFLLIITKTKKKVIFHSTLFVKILTCAIFNNCRFVGNSLKVKVKIFGHKSITTCFYSSVVMSCSHQSDDNNTMMLK